MNDYSETSAEYFKPTYLYIKQHKITGLKYFGKTIKDPLKYCGSGTKWKYHIRYHGRQHVETIWYQLFEDIDECRNYAIKFSEDNDIVNSDSWANLITEDGLWFKPETRKKMSDAKIGKPGHRKGKTHSEASNELNRIAHTGKKDSAGTRELKRINCQHAQSEDSKEKIRKTLTGTKHTSERVEKMRATKLGQKNGPQRTSICSHCQKEGGIAAMKRYHFDNCKMKL